MTAVCTACGGEPDYRIDLRHAPSPYYYCTECKAIFMQSLEKLPPKRREQVLAEMTFSPIDGSAEAKP